MINFRPANSKDISSIAHLHAESWRAHYQSNFSASYLEGPVYAERLDVWKKRFEKIDPNQYIILAESTTELVGFVCIYLSKDPKHGALIDNLHVVKSTHGKGIGTTLMQKAAAIIKANSSSSNYYLYVLADNDSAIAFYKKVGGQIEEKVMMKNPGSDGNSLVYRFVWKG